MKKILITFSAVLAAIAAAAGIYFAVQALDASYGVKLAICAVLLVCGLIFAIIGAKKDIENDKKAREE
ncbi:MAG: hypothetical protein ACI4N6_00360 [Eubacteriales bacterium]